MSTAALLRPPPQPGLLSSRGQSSRFKVHPPQILNSKSRGRVACTRLSFAAQADWNLHVSQKIYGQLHSTPRKCNVLVCQCFATPNSADKAHLLETITSSLTRLYTALENCPVVIQLAPAVGTIAFAIWGLGSLMHRGRHFFLQWNGSKWKKSRTYYVFTSYLQPLLLWIGSTLICKVLNPINFPSEASQAIKQRLLTFVGSLSTVLAFSYCLSNVIQQTQKFLLERNDSSAKVNIGFEFAGKAVYTAVWVAAITLFMELLGFSTHKWTSPGGLGTVLLTLAGQEIFTNFLSSIMIHATRPFVISERIQTKIEGYEVSGTVEHVGWWSPTIIRGGDREAVHIPNHKLTVNVVRNISQKTHWRIKTHLAINHLDVNKINNIVADMRKVLAKNPQIEHKRLHRRVFLENINPENQALLILVSCFVKTSRSEEYLRVKEILLLDLLRVISHHRARLATPIRTVQTIYEDDTHIGAQSNRPLLLVETPASTNGNREAKSHVSRGAPEERATKFHAASEPKLTSVFEGSVQNAYKLQQKAKSGDVPISNKIDPSVSPALTSSKQPPEIIEAAVFGSKVDLSEVTTEKAQLSKASSE